MQCVFDTSGPVELSTADILRGLGWSDRFELRFKHDFPVDERLYQPIEDSVRAINEAIGQFRRGYVTLVGPPGSGKSTTLTHTLRYREGIRLIRYYAFVRDDPRIGRGEAAAFLHDLCLSLEGLEIGGTTRSTPTPDTLQGLHDRIGALLGELAQDARRTGTRTVILIDGLDHIAREQSPERSLIEELPPPNAVPDGVLIVLGTQLVGLVGPSPALRPIGTQLEESGRTITMTPLSRANVHAFVRAAVPNHLLRPGDDAVVHRLSAGHPLSLAYLVKRLAAATDLDAAATLLDAGADFGGDTDVEYAAYWDGLREDVKVRTLLSLIARIRTTVDLSTIKRLADASTIERFAASAFYLFRQLTPERWAFFHNSFRQFVLRKTELDAFGQPDAKVAAVLHTQLAAVATDPASPAELRWECLYHLEQADETLALVEHAQQHLLREQFLAGRPLTDIREDVHRGLHAAAKLQDIVAIVRLLLVHKELIERNQALDDVPLADFQVELANESGRASLLIVGEQLLVPESTALHWAGKLSVNGSTVLAAKVFEAAEPVDMLAGVQRISSRGDGTLDAWVAVAWRFRPLRQMIDAIDQVKVLAIVPQTDDDSERNDSEADDAARIQLLVKIGISIQDAMDEQKYAELTDLLNTERLGREAMLRLDFRSARLLADGMPSVGDPIDAMARVIAAISPDDLSPHDAASLADVLAQLTPLAEHADRYLDVHPVPTIQRDFGQPGKEPFAPVETLFWQARASAARGRPIDPLAIRAPEKDWDFGRVLFQRLVVIVATLWGEAIANRALTPTEFVRRLGPVLAFRRRDVRSASDWHDWTTIDAATTELYNYSLLAAEAHGRDVFHRTVSAFVEEWQRPRQHEQLSWPTAARRQILLTAYEIDHDAHRTETLLDQIDGEVNSSWELHDRIEDLVSTTKARLQIGQSNKARAALNALLSKSFGIHHRKDRQIQDWVYWANRLIEIGAEPALIETAAVALLKLIPLLYGSGRGRGTSEATGELISTLALRWPETALRVCEWLLDQGAADRATALGALLGAELRSGNAHRAAAALIAAAQLLLPFAQYEEHVGDALEALLSSPLASDPVVRSALAVVRKVAESRAQSGRYLKVLDGVAETENVKRKEGKTASPRLVQADGVELGQDAVEKLAKRPTDLAIAVRGAEPQDGLEWTTVIKILFASRGGSARSGAAQALLGQRLSISALEVFVEQAVAAGEQALAELAMCHIISDGKPYGWMRFYDGGSRLAAARCFRLLDPHGYKAQTFKLFVDDYIGHDLSPGELIVAFDTLLPELADALPLQALWREIDEHLSALVDLQESPFQPPALNLSAESENSNTPLRLLHRDMDNLSPALAWEARRGFINLLEIRGVTDAAQHCLRQALAGNLRQQTAALATLNCLASVRPDLAGGFVPDLEALAWAPSGVIRMVAQTALDSLRRAVPARPAAKPLPIIYQLEIPEPPDAEASLTGELWTPGEPLPDTKDPFELTRMYHSALRRLETETGYGFGLLTHRMAQLMLVAASNETWSAEAERQQTQLNKNIGINLNYRRPRALIAQHAFGLLVSELSDSGAITWLPRPYQHFLTCTDPTVNMIAIAARPAWIKVPTGQSLGKHPIKSWLESTSEALPQLEITSTGQVVLAELTKIVSQDSDREEEIRLSVLGHRALPFRTDHEPNIYELWHQERYSAQDYPNLLEFDDEIPVSVVAGGSIFADSRFIALNPVIAAQLDWVSSHKGTFRWVDADGNTMVESLRWAEGNVEVHGGGSNEMACEGWVVIATATAWEQMRPLLQSFVRHRIAARQSDVTRKGERQMKVVKDEIPLPSL
jgi:hypothetical protein